MNQQSSNIATCEVDHVHLTWDSNEGEDFIELVQRGFQMRVRIGMSIRDVVCRQLGVTDEYLDGRISTIFLDGSPVDDVDTATIKDGSYLALSAAMPGLVGATMRKAGYYAQMRQGITYVPDEHGPSDLQAGFFTVKLFNMVAPELGPLFLAHGIWIDREGFEFFLKNRSEQFWSHCLKAGINGKEIELSAIAGGKFPGEAQRVHLKCEMMTDSTV